MGCETYNPMLAHMHQLLARSNYKTCLVCWLSKRPNLSETCGSDESPHINEENDELLFTSEIGDYFWALCRAIHCIWYNIICDKLISFNPELQ